MQFTIILTGTDPKTRKGGIGHALPGYLAALNSANISFISIPTYNPENRKGKYFLWLKQLPKIFFISRELKKSGKQPIIYSHAGAGVSLIRQFFVLLVGKLAGAKTMLQLHALEVNKYLDSTIIRLFLKSFLWQPADIILVLTPWWKDRLKKADINKNIEVISNPISNFLYRKVMPPPLKDKFKRKEKITILTMTRLEKGKGVDIVIKAIQYLPQTVDLVIAGDGTQRKMLEHLVSVLKLKNRVQFLGWVKGNEKYRILEKSDIFCLPSTLDSFGMGFVEAMAFGLPIVAVKWGPIADVVPDGIAGILVEKPDPKLIAQALLQFVNPEERYKFGQAGKKWVLQQFSPEKIGEKLRKIIDNLVVAEE